jgi:hypothetical protein
VGWSNDRRTRQTKKPIFASHSEQPCSEGDGREEETRKLSQTSSRTESIGEEEGTYLFPSSSTLTSTAKSFPIKNPLSSARRTASAGSKKKKGATIGSPKSQNYSKLNKKSLVEKMEAEK